MAVHFKTPETVIKMTADQFDVDMQGLTGFKFGARMMPLQGIFAARSARSES